MLALLLLFFVSLGAEGEGKKGMQDKGTASQVRLSDCLHIVFLRDRVSQTGDMLPRARTEMVRA